MRSEAASATEIAAAADVFIVSLPLSLQHERRSRAVKYRQASVKFCKKYQDVLVASCTMRVA